MNNYILDIELSDDELNILKMFKSEDERIIINSYSPIAWTLEYRGILLSTYLNKSGINTTNLHFLLSGIGKQLFNYTNKNGRIV